MQKNKEKIKKKEFQNTYDFIFKSFIYRVKQADNNAEFYNIYDKAGHCLLGAATPEQMKKYKNRIHKTEKMNKQETITKIKEMYKYTKKLLSSNVDHETKN